jgi:hypothetical protein
VPLADIDRIDMGARTYPKMALPTPVPRLVRRDGSGFWLDGLAGRAGDRSPDPDQLALLHALRDAIGTTGSDAMPRPSQPK